MATDPYGQMFKGKALLLTGGTGSFGQAVLRRFVKSDISQIRIFSDEEKKQDDMRHRYPDRELRFYIGDVRNRDSVREAVDGVDFIFQAAALKQVSPCEFHPMEAYAPTYWGLTTSLKGRLRGGETGGGIGHRRNGARDQCYGDAQGDAFCAVMKMPLFVTLTSADNSSVERHIRVLRMA